MSVGGVRADWEMYQGDPSHTGVAFVEPILQPALLWNQTLDSPIYAAPIFSNGRVYVGESDGDFKCLDASTGQEYWTYGGGGGISSPAIGTFRVFFGCNDGKLYALDKVTGALDWTFTTGDSVESSPTVLVPPVGIVYFGSDDGVFYALNVADGSVVWTFNPHDGVIKSCPAISDGIVYFGALGGWESSPPTFYALNATTGEEIWNFNLNIRAYDFHSRTWYDRFYLPSSASIANGIVYFGTQNSNDQTDGIFFALNATSGEEIWEQGPLPKYLNSCPAIAYGVVYTCSLDGNLYAFDALNGGDALWSFDTGFPITSPPLIVSNVIYVGSTNGTIYGLATSGAKLWSYDTGSAINAPFSVDNKKLFFTTTDPFVGILEDQSVVSPPVGGYGGSSLSLVSPSPLASVSPTPQNSLSFNYGWLILVFAAIFIVVALTQVKRKPKRRRHRR